MKVQHHNAFRITAIVLLFVVSLNAMVAGYSFISDPSGSGLGISVDYLKDTAPFKDYFVPGLILFVVNGIFSSVIAFLAICRWKYFASLISFQGCVFLGWIVIQLMMVTSFHPLHAIIGTIGIALIFLGWVLQKKIS